MYSRQPFQLWIMFLLCVSLILPAMIWLTVKTIDLDRDFNEDRNQTELARREAEIQERITSALYRMDWKLGPHIAQEAARPYYLYQSFYSGNSYAWLDSADSTELPSPLLRQPSDFVKIHFQVDHKNKFSSPQRPETQEKCERAIACCGVTEQVFATKDQQLSDLKTFVTFEQLEASMQDNFLEDESPSFAFGNSYVQPQAEKYIAQYGDLLATSKVPQQSLENPDLDEKLEVQRSRGANRGGKEFVQRQKQYSFNTKNWAEGNRIATEGLKDKPATNKVSEGIMRPVWIGKELFLARAVNVGKEQFIQGCWLSWPKIRDSLKKEVADILPDIQFEKISNESNLVPERALVTLPVQLVVDKAALLANSDIKFSGTKIRTFSGLQLALFLAWSGLLASVVATAILLHGVIRLSERRAAFVSAVTHELRTPLTTFKMYSEMLASKMVPADKQTQYAKTLQKESDRLSHLVENVLQFARLERRPTVTDTSSILIGRTIQDVKCRLNDRAKEAGFDLIHEFEDQLLDRHWKVEPHILEQVLFNLVDNACKYAAYSQTKRIEVGGHTEKGWNVFTVRDFGPGISSTNAKRVFEPFHKSDLEAANSAPGVGLGLALCKRMVESVGGKVGFTNMEMGVRFRVSFPE